MGYIYIFFTIAFTVYGQLMLKWQLSSIPNFPDGKIKIVLFLVQLILTNPYIFSGFVSAFIASLCWMMALRQFPLSIAYPFMSLSFVAVTMFSICLFSEAITLTKVLGLLLIVGGTIIVAIGHKGL